MIAAAYPLRVDQPELQRRAAMGAMQFQQPHDAALVAENDQFFPQDFDPVRQVAQFVGKADRLPKSAQVLAAWRAWTDMGKVGILVGDIAMMVATESRLQKWGSGWHRRPPLRN
jgi:hypothetical protein